MTFNGGALDGGVPMSGGKCSRRYVWGVFFEEYVSRGLLSGGRMSAHRTIGTTAAQFQQCA